MEFLSRVRMVFPSRMIPSRARSFISSCYLPCTQANGIVIDTFGGSGSTLMACELSNRICCMMELDEKYASVILRRYVEDGGNPEDVYVERNGEKFMYSDLVKQVEGENE